MKKLLAISPKLLFVLLLFSLIYIHKSQFPRILVIHSYQTDYNWVVSINEGLERVFDDKSELNIRYHYMDLKNHGEESFKKTAASLAIRVVDEWQPDVLVLFDDLAQLLVGKPYVENPTPGKDDMKIVFGGVNDDIPKYYAKNKNVWGILERKPFAAIKETLLMIAQARGFDVAKDKPRVVFIGDNSNSINAEIPQYSKIDWTPLEWLKPIQVDTIDEWKQAVHRANQEADIILLTNYQQILDKTGEEYVRPAGEIMRLTEKNSNIPVVGMGWSNGKDGAMLAVTVSPYEQGEIVAQIVLDIINDTPPDITPYSTEQFLVMICKPALERRNLAIPPLYEAFARATNNYEADC
jgi:hypothetical protein